MRGAWGSIFFCARIAAACAAITMFSGAIARAQTPPSGGYSIQRVGLTGGDYQWNHGGLDRHTTISLLNASGQAAGSSDRFSPTGDFNGNDAWFFNGTTSEMINLTGAGYDSNFSGGTERDAFVDGLSANGKVVGESDRFTSVGASSLGIDSWLYNGSVTVIINPTGTGYEYTDSDGVHRSGLPLGVDNSAHALGFSSRYAADGSDLGLDTWFYNGSTTTIIGPTGAGYNYTDAAGIHRYNAMRGGDDSLRASGDADRYATDGTYLGSDAWFYSGTTTSIVNLTGGVYEYTAIGGKYHEGHVMWTSRAMPATPPGIASASIAPAMILAAIAGSITEPPRSKSTLRAACTNTPPSAAIIASAR
jgi:hypothetical protein